jgi:hypothetical protein
MKEIWLTPREMAGKYNCPKTVQGVALRAKNENWKKRKTKGQKGGGFEYEVSDIINKFELLQNYDHKGLDKKLYEQSPNYNKDDSTDTANNDSYVIVPHLTSILFPDELDKKEPTSGMMDIRENFVLSKYWLLKTGLFNSRLAIIRASNDTMTPTINEGDIALLNVQEEALHNILNGIYLLKIKESYVIYRLQQDLNTNTIHIINDNKAYKSFTIKLDNADSHIKVIAKVEMILTSPYK